MCSLLAGTGAEALDNASKEREKREAAEAESRAKKEAAEAEALQQELARCGQSEAVQWKAIAAGLRDNEAKIANAWKGSCAKVSGVVKQVASSLDDTPYVVIGDGEDSFSLSSLHCKPEDPKKAFDLSKGDQITVWGLGTNEIMGSLVLEHCSW